MEFVLDHLVGKNKSQLQYMLMHLSATDPTSYIASTGQFYYNSTNNAIKLRDNSSWVYVPKLAGLFTSGQLTVGNGVIIQPITAPSNNSFVKVDTSSVASTQRYIAFADMNPVAYTTVISEPGVNTKFTTEKSVVDYVTSAINAIPLQGAAGNNTEIQWNNLGDLGATSELTWNNTLKKLSLSILDSGIIFPEFEIKRNSDYFKMFVSDDANAILESSVGIDIIGSTVSVTSTYFNIDTTYTNFRNGIVNKYLKLDGSKNLTFVDIPSQYVTGTASGLFDLSVISGTLRINPYTSKESNVFYIEGDDPSTNTDVLMYDGAFKATELYEGSTRVMTTHGNQTANGNLHAISTSSNAGFLRALPSVNPTLQYLRGDGNWASTSAIAFWQRNGTVLSPLNSGDTLKFTAPTYADNTAALAGGLVAGQVYKTALGILMIVY